MRAKPLAATLPTWLKNNLGKSCLGGCSGQDFPALLAAVHVAELWTHSDFDGRARAAEAYRHIVSAMQPDLRYLAFHAVAHAAEWGHREELWAAARLEPLSQMGNFPGCAFGPEAGRGLNRVPPT